MQMIDDLDHCTRTCKIVWKPHLEEVSSRWRNISPGIVESKNHHLGQAYMTLEWQRGIYCRLALYEMRFFSDDDSEDTELIPRLKVMVAGEDGDVEMLDFFNAAFGTEDASPTR